MDNLFANGVKFEENGDWVAAERAYTMLLRREPGNASALINLGTICYNAQRFTEALRHYRAALQIDPRYALAHFDLANVLDETDQHELAIMHYQNAIKIDPLYADAIYNLALAYEKTNQPRRALLMWRKYCKLDPASPWHTHAKTRAAQLMRFETLHLVWVNPKKPKKAKRRGSMFAC